MDKQIYVGFAILKLSKLHMYETFYDELQPYFGEENIQIYHMDTDSFVLSVNAKDIIKDLKHLGDIFDFRNLEENHGIFSNKNKNSIGFFKVGTPNNISIDEFVCFISKAFSFKCEDDNECQNKSKGASKPQSKHIKFEE